MLFTWLTSSVDGNLTLPRRDSGLWEIHVKCFVRTSLSVFLIMLEGTSFIEQYPGTNNSLTLRLSHCHITAATSDAITTQRLMHKTGAPEYIFTTCIFLVLVSVIQGE